MISTRETSRQPRAESKTGIVEQITLYLRSGDYSRALDLLREAAAEFPNDAELSVLETLAQDSVKRKADANRLITESQELFAQRKAGEAIQLLRKAYELDRHNSLARTILANALVEHAYSIVETDWWEAETLTNEALALNPAHPTAKTIHIRILDQKTEGSVEDWVAQTRKLQSSGNLSAALAQIAEAFAIYPHEPRLLLIQDAIQRDHNTQRRQSRRRDLEDLQRNASELEAVAGTAEKKALADRIKAVTAKYSTDGEILSIANALLLRLGQLGVPHSSHASPDGERTALLDHGASPSPPPIAAKVLRDATSQVPPNWISNENVRKGKVPTSKARPNIVQPDMVPPGIALGSMVPGSKAPPAKVSTALPEQLTPPEVLPALVAQTSASAAKETSTPLRPEQPARSNSTKLIFASAAAIIVIAAISYFAGTRHAPAVAKSSAAPSTAQSSVSTSAVSASAQKPSEALAPVPSLPSSLVSSNATTEQIVLNDQAHAGSAPVSRAPIESGHKLGTLLVVTGQENARVFLDGRPQPQLTQAGQLILPSLEFKDYVVQVSKSGFQDPPQQKIRIRKGEEARLIFNLQPKNPQPNLQPPPRLASLTIQGGVPGTTVLVDLTTVGSIQPDGTLSITTVNPGDHTVELRRERLKPRQFKKQFVAGEVVSLAAADAALEAAPGELTINFTPADATVAIAKANALPTVISSGVLLNLSPGTYTLTARTSERFTRSSTLEVTGGQSKTLDLSLAPNGMSKWDAPSAWKHEKDSFIRKGGDFVLYGIVPASGTFAFSAIPTKGHALQWVLNYIDAKNYVLFQIDDDNFRRTVVRNGQKTDEIIVPDKSDRKSLRTLRIRVSPTEIMHQIQHGESWRVLDRWVQPAVDLSLGKFGFYIPGNDEVTLSSFAHYADLNVR